MLGSRRAWEAGESPAQSRYRVRPTPPSGSHCVTTRGKATGDMSRQPGDRPRACQTMSPGQGRRACAEDFAVRALGQPKVPGQLQVEIAFYRYANGTPADRIRRRRELRMMLDHDMRAPNWDLTANVARAIADSHPDAEHFAVLTAVIDGKQDLSALSGWRALDADA